ncbi:GntR family transcriptional regulator [Kocuria marina]|uniref:GntR family transcriptional regulator n=1 Tax=Kocuria marina TaxID=223184 RepID=UPI001C92DF5C
MTSFHDRSSSSEDIARELTRDTTSRAAGTRLPSHRALVTRFGASASTVSRARALFAQRGLVVSRPGAGRGREDVLVGIGGQAALSTAMRVVAPPGDPVPLEAPTHPGTLAAARAAACARCRSPWTRTGCARTTSTTPWAAPA